MRREAGGEVGDQKELWMGVRKMDNQISRQGGGCTTDDFDEQAIRKMIEGLTDEQKKQALDASLRILIAASSPE